MFLSCASSLERKLGPRQHAAVREGRAYGTRSIYNVEYRNWLRSARNKVRHGVRNAAAQVCLLIVEWVLLRIPWFDMRVLLLCTNDMKK